MNSSEIVLAHDVASNYISNEIFLFVVRVGPRTAITAYNFDGS